MPIEEIVRAGETPQRSRGHRAPSTRNVNQGTPTVELGSDINPQPQPFATTRNSNDMKRWPQQNLSLANLEELASADIPVGGSYEIDPNVLAIWNLQVTGLSLTLSFAALEAVSEDLQRSIWNGARRVRTLQININWLTDGEKTVTIADIEWADGGQAPSWTSAPGKDIITIQIDSDGQTIGFVNGLDAKAPA